MKNTLHSFLWALFALVIITGCSEEEVNPPTALEFTVTDGTGNRVSGATIKLFTSEVDLKAKTNQFGQVLTTDTDGKATFKDLQSVQYFWLVEKGCQNNVNGSVTTTSPLEANKTTVVTSILSQTGTLNLNNTSSNPYKLYVNGELIGTTAGKSSYTIPNVPTGSYAIRVVQESGYLIEPTIKDYSVTVTCGNTTAVTYP